MFTINSPAGLFDLDDFGQGARYVIYSEESGGENHTHHLQGYVEYEEKKTLAFLRRLDLGAHWEIRRGTRRQARDYCTKKDDPTFIDGPYEFGDWDAGGQGARNDVYEFRDAIISGESDKELLMNYTPQFFRYERMVPKVRLITVPPRDFKTEVIVHYGPPGVGKTYWCVQHSRDAGRGLYFKQRDRQGEWWDNYNGTDDIIFDDFYGWIYYDSILRYCDAYACQAPVKGNFAPFRPRTIYFTSNKLPANWLNGSINWSSFTRRVTKWFTWEFGADGQRGIYVVGDSWAQFELQNMRPGAPASGAHIE